MTNNQEHQETSFDPEQYSLEEILKPKNCALIIVDVQNDFCDSNGFFATKLEPKADVTQMQSIVPYIQTLIDAAHAANVPVIFTKGYEDVRFRSGPDLRRAVRWKEKDGDGTINSQSGTWGSDFYRLEPIEGDVVVEKHKWSAFDGKDAQNKPLKKLLDDLDVKTLVVAGVVAETCIETTIRDAYDQNYFVVVPKNSVGSNDTQQLEARMNYWAAGFIGDVVEEDVIKNAWR